MPAKVTLKDIAKELGVTTTTVHRALQGKIGVSDEMREEIQRVAMEKGYKSNYMAAALKRKEVRIAIALPETQGDNRFYYGNMWKGIRNFLTEVMADFNVVALEYTYSFDYGANGDTLKQIYDTHADHLDGLITIGVEQGQSLFYMEKFSKKNIPIVLISSDIHQDFRLCCVRSYDEVAGSLAAELLTTFSQNNKLQKIIIIGHFNRLGMNDQIHNILGFDTRLRLESSSLTTVQIRNSNYQTVCNELQQMLLNDPDIFAIYSCSARYTIYVSRLIEELGLAGKIKVIGNDCFEESVDFLQRGVLTAIVDKKILQQSYLAIKILFNYIVKNEYPRSSLLKIKPEVVLQSQVKNQFAPGFMYDETGRELNYK